MATRTRHTLLPFALLLTGSAHAGLTEDELSELIQAAAIRATDEVIDEERTNSSYDAGDANDADTEDDIQLGDPGEPVFGEDGYASLDIEFGVAVTQNNEDYQLRVGYSTFLVDDFQISYGVSAWYHDQEIDNQASASFDFSFRYHFWKEDTDRGVSPSWTLYGETGIGVMASSGDVPDLGSTFNFIPRAGGGVTFAPFDDSAVRINLGLRWHHISNGSVFGSDENPDRDALMIFTGVVIPL